MGLPLHVGHQQERRKKRPFIENNGDKIVADEALLHVDIVIDHGHQCGHVEDHLCPESYASTATNPRDVSAPDVCVCTVTVVVGPQVARVITAVFQHEHLDD
jgi:hypothetical protein